MKKNNIIWYLKFYPYYHCTKKGCGFKPIRKEIAEDIFTNYLKSIEPTN